MAYWNTKGKNTASTENFGLGGASSGGSSGTGGEFYELEPAVVLDIILDKDHPIFKQPANVQMDIDVTRWPSDLSGNKPIQGEKNYSWVGRALVRLIYSTPTGQKDKLVWASPMDVSVSEYPLVNEVVMIARYQNKYFYSKKINSKNFPNDAVDFNINYTVSGQDNTELYSNEPYAGRESKTSHDGKEGYKGVAGRYYKINSKIRTVKRYEGDLLLESRFGQSIRFAAYDDDRDNDQGDSKNVDYKDFGGNPMLILRNRQRKLLKEGETLQLVNSPNPATITGTTVEKNAGGYIKENINHDGSSFYMTSGQTISGWVTTCYKKMFGVGEEVSSFNGNGYTYPVLNGDQIVLNSDRLILSSRYGETFHYSKKRYSIVTDNEYAVDSHQQLVLTTNTKAVINSPVIFLGEYDITDEPAVLGQTLANWLYELCNWIGTHTHWYIHAHVDAGKESPSQTQLPVQIQQLYTLRDKIHTILSRRVFITGGGFAPGQDGGNITDGTTPTKINLSSGSGVPGGWKGANKR